MSLKVLKISPRDNVAVALEELSQGEAVHLDQDTVTVLQTIPRGHKVALQNLHAGENIIKYGEVMGQCTQAVNCGEHVHTHNVRTTLSDQSDYQFSGERTTTVKSQTRQILAYERPSGDIGIRNEIWVITTVGCVNNTAQKVVELARQNLDLSGLDGIFSLTHPFGCSQLGDDHLLTRQTLINLVRHPNAGGVLVLGLGCENNGIKAFKEALGDYDANRIKFLSSQKSDDEIEDSLALVEEILHVVKGDRRTPVPFSRLKVGFKCGGSDGLSGITANPLVGQFSDWHVEHGGTAVLTEVPEMFGAETLLMKRALNRQVFEKIVTMINAFKTYFQRLGQPIYENPSPGNKDGGITTLEDKSLGCIQKGGRSTIVDVLNYGERLQCSGLNLMNGPGNDMVSVTSLIAAGAHLVLFTTGRGTPFGGPVPTLKISSNTPLAEKKKNWIDYNAGAVLDGKNFANCREELIDLIADIASGDKKSKNEIHGYREIAIFKDGVTL